MPRAYGSSSDLLRGVAAECARRDASIERLAFCYDVYLEFTRDGREPNDSMDATKATRQLEEAVCDVLGVPKEDT